MFKVGDRVKFIGKSSGEKVPDYEANGPQIKHGSIILGKNYDQEAAIVIGTYGSRYVIEYTDTDNNRVSLEFLPGDLELIKGKRGRPSIKPRPVKFLLKYDLDRDPIEEFETMDQVNERIKYLVEHERSLKKESMIVYEIKSKKAVSVETKIKLK